MDEQDLAFLIRQLDACREIEHPVVREYWQAYYEKLIQALQERMQHG